MEEEQAKAKDKEEDDRQITRATWLRTRKSMSMTEPRTAMLRMRTKMVRSRTKMRMNRLPRTNPVPKIWSI